ncbi:MAG: phosphatidate cytidylyltransferase [Pseudomonadota bacterium]
MTDRQPTRGRFEDLLTRSLTGLALGAVTLAAAAVGGVLNAALFGIAAAAMVWELARITGTRIGLPVFFLIAAALVSVLMTQAILLRYGMLVLLLGAGLAVAAGLRRDPWLMTGYAWIGLAMCCVEGLRDDPVYGFEAVLWLFLTVIASDVGGYFGGRLIGGPKLWPRLSPKKTWAGSLAGMALAALVGAAFSRMTTGTLVQEVVPVSALVAFVAQLGDLGESALKRRFGAKDSSGLLPGHGGVLDRLDGLMAAAILSAAITFARGKSIFIW